MICFFLVFIVKSLFWVQALTGLTKGFKGNVLEVSLNIKFNHCMSHREALVTKKTSTRCVNKVYYDAIDVIHFIKSKVLNSRLFTILCNEMGSRHEKLLLHTNVS